MAIDINREIPRTMTLSGLDYLGKMARCVPKNGLIVEIGPLFGSSTWVLAKNADPTVRVISIDTWEPQSWIDAIEAKFPGCQPFSKSAFEYYTRDCPNVMPIQGFSPDVLRDWNEPIDLFFDDATHGNPGFSESLDFYIPRTVDGGIICGDDYAAGWPDIVTTVNALARFWGEQPEIIGRVWALRKPMFGQPATVFQLYADTAQPQLALFLTAMDGNPVTNAPNTWVGHPHTQQTVCALAINVDPKDYDLDISYQVQFADGTACEPVCQGTRIESTRPICGFRAVLSGADADKFILRYQACVVTPRRHTANTRLYRAGNWINPDALLPFCALRCELVKAQ